MHFYWLPPFLAAALDLVLCIVVLWHAPRRRLNQIFTLFALSLTLWNLDIAALYFFTDYADALYWSEAFRYGAFFIAPSIYHLGLILTERWTVATRVLLLAGYVIASFLCVLNAQGMLVDHLETMVWGYYPVGRPLYNVWTLSFLFYCAAAVYHVGRGLSLGVSARQRQQLKALLLGLGVALLAGLTNFLRAYGVPIYPVGNLGNVFLCGVLTYAIVRHRLLDVDLIITKTTASVVALVLWLVPLWLLTAWVQQRIYGTSDIRLLSFALTVFVLSGLVFPWLLRATEAAVRRMLWGQRYTALQALGAFQKTIIQVLDQKKIVEDLREVLSDALQASFVAVYLYDASTGRWVDAPREDEYAVGSGLLQTLQHQSEPLVQEDISPHPTTSASRELVDTMAARGAEVCVPLRAHDRLIGMVLLGKKRNREIFSVEDLRLLATLAAEVAVALENARLYEELRTSQVMLARSDRLAAIGTLASGIAHEIRNPLVSIQTFTQLLPERVDDPEFRTSFFQLMSNELSRVTTLVNDLLTFARPSPPERRQVDLNDLARQVARLLMGEAKKKGITLVTELSDGLPTLYVDQAQIKQVFMNLVLNALQATARGGRVGIHTKMSPGVNGRTDCVIEIQDSGEGISTEKREQIFDPFFTTKDTGVGLGLFITHQIVKEHGGSIDVESVPGQGTRFLARLPVTGTAVRHSL